jgi:hypothetical protein
VKIFHQAGPELCVNDEGGGDAGLWQVQPRSEELSTL